MAKSRQMTIDDYIEWMADKGLGSAEEMSERSPAIAEALKVGELTAEGMRKGIERSEPKILFKRLHVSAIIPTKAHPSDSGFDLYASEDVIIEPGETVIVPTGVAVGLPKGMEAQVRPRSGITSKTKLRVQLGTIDNGYTGEIGVIVDNTFPVDEEDRNDFYLEALTVSDDLSDIWEAKPFGTYLIRKGDKIAQLVVQYLPQFEAVEVDELTESARGRNGFGSTDEKEAE